MSWNLLGLGQRTDLSVPNPISKDTIESIRIEISGKSSIFRGGKKCSATIYFKNGNTTANHDIFDDDFNSLMEKVQAFNNSL